MQALQTIRPQDMLTDPTLPTAVAPASPQPAPPRPQPQQAAPIPTIRPAANSIPTIRGWQPSPQRQAQEAALQSSLIRQEAPRTPAKGFWGKAGRVLGDIGNVAGTVILGTDKMAAIPGTSEYRAAQYGATGRELTQLETQDQAEQNDEAKRELEGAQTQNLENPPNTIEPAQEGIFGINPRNLTATPVSAPGGQPLHPYVKPGPFSRVAIQDPNDPTNGIEAIEQDGVIYVPGPNGALAPVTNPRPFEKPTQQHPTAGLVGGRAAFGLYDPQKGWVDPTTKQPLPGFTPPPSFAETGLWQPTEGLDDKGNLVPGKLNARTGQFVPNRAGAPSALPKDVTAEIGKELQAVRDARTKLGVMQQNESAALGGDQQAMLSLVANHIGMTLGQQKGSRISQAVWNEAIQSAPWTERIYSKWFHTDSNGDHVFDGFKSGVTLTGDQIKQMVNLANVVYQQRQIQLGQAYEQYGVPQPQTGWSAPKDAPTAPKQDGKYLYDGTTPIAKSQGGKWVQP